MTIIVITLLFYLNFIFKDFIFYINDMIIHIKTGIKIFLILNLINEQCFNILCCGCCPCNKKKLNSTDNSQYIEFGSSNGEDVNSSKGKDVNDSKGKDIISSKKEQNIKLDLNKENKLKKEELKIPLNNTMIKDSSADSKKNETKNNIIKNPSKQPPISSKQPPILSNLIPIPYNQPPKIGLKNVGATCYMNATLQCLSQIYHLVEYFKNNQQVKNTIDKFRNKNELCLTESFKILIDNLWPQYYNNNHQKNSTNYYYAPNEFKDKISNMNPLFQGAQANDAKDLVNFIIMTLHEELNIYPKINNNNYAIMDPKLQCNQIFVFNNFMNYFFKENKSIISDIFYGIHHSTTLCSQCKCLKHNYEVYFFLTFPLEEVRKYKLQNLTARNNYIMNQNMMMNMYPMMMNQMNMNPMMMNPMNMNNNMNMNINMNINMNNNMNLQQEFNNNLNKMNLLNQNKVDIYDCFEYCQNPEELTGQNAMYCDNCQSQFPAKFTTTLYNGPEVLIIVLNRGTGNQFKTKLKFNFYLDLTNFLEDKNSACQYELIGLVTHMGENGGSGHFIATCKSPIDGIWYQYNDDLVFPVTDFNQQMLDYATPYILFYKKGGI